MRTAYVPAQSDGPLSRWEYTSYSWRSQGSANARVHAQVDMRAFTKHPCDETRVRFSLVFNLFRRWGCFHRIIRDCWVHQGETGAQSNCKTSQMFFNSCALKMELIDLLKMLSRCSNGRKLINGIKKCCFLVGLICYLVG